jgi:endonuclease G
VRNGLYPILLVLLILAFRHHAHLGEEAPAADRADLREGGAEELYFLPTRKEGRLVRHRHYALSYVERYELAEWVAYELTGARLQGRRVERTDDFRADPLVPGGSADPADYAGSYWDRGHLVPAADMAFSRSAMSETFFLSNVAPQAPGFNQGVWRELEELTREWAKDAGHLYVVSGPVLEPGIREYLGRNRVAVPKHFYRVLLDLRAPERKAVAFLLPNEVTDAPLPRFAVTIDSVEQRTGLDFFPDLLEPDLEERLEGTLSLEEWEFDERKYRLRVDKWNKRK